MDTYIFKKKKKPYAHALSRMQMQIFRTANTPSVTMIYATCLSRLQMQRCANRVNYTENNHTRTHLAKSSLVKFADDEASLTALAWLNCNVNICFPRFDWKQSKQRYIHRRLELFPVYVVWSVGISTRIQSNHGQRSLLPFCEWNSTWKKSFTMLNHILS